MVLAKCTALICAEQHLLSNLVGVVLKADQYVAEAEAKAAAEAALLGRLL